ncbi:MAG: Gfo/Idh/MocA family oxidoreductase [Kiritimatiellaeota bacterium]|nr:Gfo/Idh/MocA family oxidoreductase [Kiritimatiellota bacterium]
MKSLNRRSFLKTAGTCAAFTIIPAHVIRSETAPSNQITRALLGFGGIARSGAHLGFTSSRLIALCDPDRKRMEEGIGEAEKRGYGKIHVCRDFREILAMPDVDIAHICTPPHWHGVMSVMAAEAGKDVWCEKPMTRTIGEGRRVMEAVKANNRIFRLNTWFRFQDGFYGFGTDVKPIKKVAENRILGWPLKAVVGEVTGFTLKFGWSGMTNVKPEPVPEHFDYDLWLGPAPFKPYHPHRTHGTFRGYWDYDGGGLGDMGQHYLDPVQYLLEKDDTSPVKVEIDAPPQHPDAVGSFRRITLTYADGCQIILDGNDSLKGEPFLEGPKGKLWQRMRSDIPNLDAIVAELPEPRAQQTDFMESVRLRRPFALNERNGFRSATIVNLALVAMRLGRGFAFDPDKLCAVNDPAADKFIYQQMRDKWAI